MSTGKEALCPCKNFTLEHRHETLKKLKNQRGENQATKVNFLGPETTRWGGGLPREGVVSKKVRAHPRKLVFLGFPRGITGCPRNLLGCPRPQGQGKKKAHKHKYIYGIVPGLGGWQMYVYVFFSSHFSWPRKDT